MANLFDDIPKELSEEVFQYLLTTEFLRIERIVSKGHSSPKSGWYDQSENEWVMVLSGFGVLEFEDGRKITLNPGDYINIKAHEKHKVIATAPEEVTVWLAIFY
ncbi:cupin domain-containing protein [Corallincola platygyrae]|uniref:Cupin domain-containing protein n=1 Tax=Corallincola platygyrae TaxID=1193278 RepID=A0ABW4XQU7_9GAMM